MPAWIAADGDGARLELLVQPRASRSRVVGPHGDRLKVQIAAPPVDGAANAAVVALVAAEAGVPKRAVTLVRGRPAGGRPCTSPGSTRLTSRAVSLALRPGRFNL